MTHLIHAVVSLGMLVVVPLALPLLPTRTTSTHWWFAFAFPGAVWGRSTAILLVISGSVLGGTMLLAVMWALGHVVGTPYLPFRWMVATHGVANAVGFAFCGVLAMRREELHEGG